MNQIQLDNGKILQFRNAATRKAVGKLINKLWWEDYAYRELGRVPIRRTQYSLCLALADRSCI